MLRTFFILFVLIHGLIHLMGFVKAFQLAPIQQLTKEISRPAGALWLVTALLFVVSVVFIVLKKDWWLVGLAAVALSQILIFTVWQDARFGTMANAVVLVGVLIGWMQWHFERGYRADVRIGLERTKALPVDTILAADLAPLPEPVQRYLRYAGVLNKPKIRGMRVVIEGGLREKGKEWMPFRSEQYNFFDVSTRLFFLKATMKGLPVHGYHAFKDGHATMLIKLLSVFPVARAEGPNLNQAETVTYFNDLCLLAPAALLDPKIQWEPIDSLSTRAIFTNQGIPIRAILFFNQKGQLINFRSDDRYALAEKKQIPFWTPMQDYKNFNGYNIGSYG
ncbi:MAG: DUF6544 family protein, partial [Saprospiraceae bacterium]